jgi:hypothetical protein
MAQMFEHMKNYKALFQKVSTWLRPTKEGTDDPALLFVHIFCHKSMPYHFVEDDGWMAKNFFSGKFHHYPIVSCEGEDPNRLSITYYLGGTMPSHDLFVGTIDCSFSFGEPKH